MKIKSSNKSENLRIFLHIFLVFLLTLTTQVGGIIWVLIFGTFKIVKVKYSLQFRLLIFALAYLINTFLIVPKIAVLFGRVSLPISKKENLVPHNFLTVLMNRNYVNPKLKKHLVEISERPALKNSNLKLAYLDANFPFIDGFPLLPHLSHNDGKKIDLSFYYLKDNIATNEKPSRSGYGVFENPRTNETNQTEICKNKGAYIYDYSKFLTFGQTQNLSFDEKNTKSLLKFIIEIQDVQKVFIEPHLVTRLQLSHPKIKFQGCHSVRHDDHIHLQIK